MKSRAEIVEDAIAVSGEDVRVLWALALNDQPLRRAYFEAVSDRTQHQVVKCLARLANAGLLSPTDGLLFAIDNPKVRALLAERVSPDEGQALAISSLEFGEGRDDLPEMFFVEHSLRAQQVEAAAIRLLDQTPSEPLTDPALRGALVSAMARTFQALQEQSDVSDDIVLSVGQALLIHGQRELKPKAWRDLTAVLEGHPAATDALRSQIDEANSQVKALRKQGREEPSQEQITEQSEAAKSEESVEQAGT